MPTDTLPYADRLDRLRTHVKERGAEVAVLTPGPDVEYLLGHSVASHERLSCLVVPIAGSPTLLVPQLERLGWAGTAAEDAVRIATWLDGQDPYALVADLLPAGTARIAVGDHMPAGHALHLRDAVPGSELSLAGEAVAALRVRKSAAEIEELAAAGAAIDRVQERIGEWLRPGRTEHEIAADIAAAIRAEGHQRADFVIVGSGPNGASPHHEASDRVVQAGDVVVIDIGGPHRGGYFSDCTRTYQVVGEPDPEFAAVYDVVQRAQQAGVDAAVLGATCESVDAAARRVVVDAGYGEFFITRTGHGIGLEVHEEPYMVAGNSRPLAAGMAFSVEPGIYLPGRFGIRIEDIVVATEAGPRRVNNCTRDLTVV
ncbi:M24 family metallopeptidase [Nakamurella deserti]|uniref:M24 family metallopeptidase n=1 Tax=Nakamurella deserti TaxID=2164074 RepID=UPI000DBE958A|nr:Xaa-Pro peptidase family protein [Nakamurella deserti]